MAARETRPSQNGQHDTTVDDVRAKAASAGVWLRRTEFTTDRFWLPERPQIIRVDADPRPPQADSAAAVNALVVSGNRSTERVHRPATRERPPRASSHGAERSVADSPWRSIRTGPDQSVAERYSVASAMEVRLHVVVIFATLLGILALLLLYILIRSLGR